VPLLPLLLRRVELPLLLLRQAWELLQTDVKAAAA
jgi:hypothetical protein